ncbi:hypothetical protein K438DRAFT_1974672 [Mycena galopus ATCC 62051]|nr:hypothetical protein K438DRAFT_1974672 [Mycena galopus ATCC 62051]
MPSPASAPTTPVEVLLTPSEASSMLRTLSLSKIQEFARKSTTLGTSDRLITDESFASILSRCTVVFSSNKTWSLHLEVKPSDVKPLEYVALVYPRSSWAFNVGPGGNYGQVAWKTNDKCPKGIEVQPQPGRGGTDSDSCWLKTTRSPTDLQLFWNVQMWTKQFLNPRTAEYAVSGRPVAWDTSVDIHERLDARWASFAQGRDDLEKKKGSNGPSTSMFLSARRPVFCANAATQDEGRASEYDDTYNLLAPLADADLRFNRVPEVLIYNANAKTYHPMSFHQLHRLGAGLVMLMTMTPIAFSWGGKQIGNKKDLSWEYRLLTITVLGRREEDALASPSKMVIKRKVALLDLEDSDDERPAKKTSGSGGKTAGPSGASGSAPGAGPSGASGGPSGASGALA